MRSILFSTLVILLFALPIFTIPSTTASNKIGVVTMIHVGVRPSSLAYNPSNGDVYVVSGSCVSSPCPQGSVWIISSATNKVVAKVRVGESPRGIVYDPSNKDVYVADEDDCTLTSSIGNVSVLRGTVLVTTIHGVGSCPTYVNYDPANKFVYVISASETPDRQGERSAVYVIDGSTNSVIAKIATGISESGNLPVYDPANHELYVPASSCGFTSCGFGASPNRVIVISGTKMVANISTPIGTTLAYDPVNNYIYATGAADKKTAVIDGTTNKVVAMSSTWGTGISFDPATGNVYFANYSLKANVYSANVTEISSSTNKIVTIINAGGEYFNNYPFAYNPSSKNLYVAGILHLSGNGGHNSNAKILVINPQNQIVANLTLPRSGYGACCVDNHILYDPSNNLVYLTNYFNSTVSVISS